MMIYFLAQGPFKEGVSLLIVQCGPLEYIKDKVKG